MHVTQIRTTQYRVSLPLSFSLLQQLHEASPSIVHRHLWQQQNKTLQKKTIVRESSTIFGLNVTVRYVDGRAQTKVIWLLDIHDDAKVISAAMEKRKWAARGETFFTVLRATNRNSLNEKKGKSLNLQHAYFWWGFLRMAAKQDQMEPHLRKCSEFEK